MNAAELQEWLNDKGQHIDGYVPLVVDGIGGRSTRQAFIQVFKNKNAHAVTESDLMYIAQSLGDTDTKRIKAIGKVESAGSPYQNDGLVKILWERHYFYKFVKRTIYLPGYKDHFLSNPKWGGYTSDFNKNGINDSWEKLSHAVCIDVDGALQSISIGKFQVMGIHYKKLGYKHPIDMLWDASRNEMSHYKMLASFILNVANLKNAFLKISRNPENNRAFAKGYNGSAYAKHNYHGKIASAMA